MGLRTCSSKEEAIQAAEAGLLWLDMGPMNSPSWRKRLGLDVALSYGSIAWPPAAFAVLVEDDEECDSPPPVSKD